MNDELRELTFGEKACGVSLIPIPGVNPEVAQIKRYFAAMVDTLHLGLENDSDPEVQRMIKIAITHVQTAQMWAVKAITWKS